jgi:hypothetical protein
MQNLPAQFPGLNRKVSGRSALPEIEDFGQRPKFIG